MHLQYPKYHFKNSMFYKINTDMEDVATNSNTQKRAQERIAAIWSRYDNPYNTLNDVNATEELLRMEEAWDWSEEDTVASLLLMDERRWNILQYALKNYDADDILRHRVTLECARHDPVKTYAVLESHMQGSTQDAISRMFKCVETGQDLFLKNHPGVPVLIHVLHHHEEMWARKHLTNWIDLLFANKELDTMHEDLLYIEDAHAFLKEHHPLKQLYRNRVNDHYFLFGKAELFTIYDGMYGDIAWKNAPFKDLIESKIDEGADYVDRWTHIACPKRPMSLKDETPNAWTFTKPRHAMFVETMIDLLSQPENIHFQESFFDRTYPYASPSMLNVWVALKNKNCLHPNLETPYVDPYALYPLIPTYTPEQLQDFVNNATYLSKPEHTMVFDLSDAKTIVSLGKKIPRLWMNNIAIEIWARDVHKRILHRELQREDSATRYYPTKMDEALPDEMDRRILKFFADYLSVVPTEMEYQQWIASIHVHDDLQLQINVLELWEQHVRPNVTQQQLELDATTLMV